MSKRVKSEDVVDAVVVALVWSYDDFLEAIGIITSYMPREANDYHDFLAWHKTCKKAWAPLSKNFYGKYFQSFVAWGLEKSRALYQQTPHVDYYHRIGTFESLGLLCGLVRDIEQVLRTLKNYQGTRFCLTSTLHSLRWEFLTDFLSESQINVINMAAHHIKMHFGWEVSLVSISDPNSFLKTPIKFTSFVNVKNYKIQVTTTHKRLF